MPLVELGWAFTVALLLLLAALGLGLIAFRAIGICDVSVFRTWLASVLGLGLMSTATLLIGLAGGLYVWLFGPSLVLLALVGAYGFLQCVHTNAVTTYIVRIRSDPLSFVTTFLLVGMILSALVWILGAHALIPPHEWDEVAYHLDLAKLYVAAHQIFYIPYNVTSNWPLNNEMLFSLALLLGSDIAPHLLMLSSTILILIGILIAGRHYFNDQVGLVAAALFMSIPLVKRLAGTSLIDVALGMYVLAAFLVLMRWRETQHWPWLVLCGAFCGFAAGSKLMGGGFAILFGLLVLGSVIGGLGSSRAKMMPLKARNRPVSRFATLTLFKAAATFSLAGAAMVGPWYLRSFAFTGNPIWPFGFAFFGGRNWDALGDEYHMHLLIDVWTVKLPRTPFGLFESFYVAVTSPGDLGGYGGGFGTLFALSVIGALLIAWWSPLFVRYALGISAGFYVLWFAFVSHQLRYLLPVAPLLALAGAYAFDWLHHRVRFRSARVLLLVLLVSLLWRTWPWANEAERGLFVERTTYARGAITRDAWLDSQIDVMPLFRYANTQLPSNAKILLLPYENRSYYLHRDYFWGHPISQRVIRFEQFNSVSQLASYLRTLGITHVIDNPMWVYDGLRYWKHDRALMLALRDECGLPLVQHSEAVLYQLSACK